jgi:metal iron transporter
MNCPSRNDETLGHDGWNQSPARLSADTTTRQDLNGIANAREQREHGLKTSSIEEEARITETPCDEPAGKEKAENNEGELVDAGKGTLELQSSPEDNKPPHRGLEHVQRYSRRGVQILTKYVKFIGPGFMIAVA